MPDAARLVSALFLALIAFIVSGQIMPLMPEGTDFGYFTWINVALGLICGWVVMGKRAGRGVTAAINNGVTGVVSLVFWALFVQGAYEMFRLAMRNRYGGPFEALAAIFTIAVEYGLILLAPSILFTLLIGGVLAGFAADYAKKKWR
jgi:cation transport ATPase